MDKNLLMQIIERMENEGFKIHGFTFDLGNKTLMSEIGFFQKEHYFENPADPSRKVYFFPDSCHNLKNARNHLLDDGFQVPSNDGTLVDLTKHDFEEILEKDSGEFKINFQLTPNHLNCKNNMRQRVRLAAQLLSNKCAKAMTKLHPEATAKQKAIETFDNWFDSMNSRRPYDQKQNRCGFGIHRDKQMKALDDMETFLETFKVKGKTAWDPWTYGIYISIQSMRALFDELVENGPFEHILTARLNQDCLENFFSRFRGISALMNFIRALKLNYSLVIFSGRWKRRASWTSHGHEENSNSADLSTC